MQKRMIPVWPILMAMVWGCAAHTGPKQWNSHPATQAVVRPGYAIELSAVREDKPFFTAFAITIKNSGSQPLKVDWQKSRYLHKDKPNGRFMFAGLTNEAIKQALPADTIAPGGRLAKKIWPINLVTFAPYRDGTVGAGTSGFSRGVIPAGENGIRLVLQTAGKAAVESLSIAISSSR